MTPNAGPLREPRQGVMLHFSAGTFTGTVAWCRDPQSKVSYNVVLGPVPGQRTVLASDAQRAWHAGVCRSSTSQLPYRDANSAFYGVAVATGNPAKPVTAWQFEAVVSECVRLFSLHGWPLTEGWRIVGHDTEAWPRGRKMDPTGTDPAKPILSVAAVRAALVTPAAA